MLVNRSLRHFSTDGDYLVAIREDLAEWMGKMFPDDRIEPENFYSKLETGTVLCQHANDLTNVIRNAVSLRTPFVTLHLKNTDKKPLECISFIRTAKAGSFHARDNICKCLSFYRRVIGIRECLIFETDDLVMRKREKSVLLCLMEVARFGAKLGMTAPELVRLENEIEESEAQPEVSWGSEESDDDGTNVESDQRSIGSSASVSGSSGISADFNESIDSRPPSAKDDHLKCLDQVVKEKTKICQCATPFLLRKVNSGKYRVGQSQLVIFVRVLRNHVMVRVGGGWDTLDHFLDKHDPCRQEQPRVDNGKASSRTDTRPSIVQRAPEVGKSASENGLQAMKVTTQRYRQDSNDATDFGKSGPARTNRRSVWEPLSDKTNGNMKRCKSMDILSQQRKSLGATISCQLPSSEDTTQKDEKTLQAVGKEDPWLGAQRRHREKYLGLKSKFENNDRSGIRKSYIETSSRARFRL